MKTGRQEDKTMPHFDEDKKTRRREDKTMVN